MSPALPHDQQSIEQAKRDCRHDEHIHRGDPISVIAEECPPALGRRVSLPDHVLGYTGLSDIDAELEEFSMDPRRSPQRIGSSRGSASVCSTKLLAGHPALSISSANIIGSQRDVI
jgi:hypothetical protein